MNKVSLRSELRAKLEKMSADEVARASDAITRRFIEFVDWSTLRNMHIYRSEERWQEVQTEELIQWIEAEHPGITVSLVKPYRNAALPSEQFDLIVVPLLGFDEQCNRLGRGAGWYDRFLHSQQNAQTIGLAFETCKIDSIPVEPHDVSLNSIITEQTVYQRSRAV